MQHLDRIFSTMNRNQPNSPSQEYVLVPAKRAPVQPDENGGDGPSEEKDGDARRRGALHSDARDGAYTVDVPEVKLSVHRAIGGLKRASKPIQAWLSYYSKVAGAANTAFAATMQVRPNADSSWASWQAVFDECKVLGAECHWNVNFTTFPTANANQTPNAVVVYEPGEPVALADVNSALQYEHFQLNAINYIAYAASPLNTAKGGRLTFKCKMPAGTQLSVVDNLLSTGMWRPTTDASNYYWGNFQFYVAQGGVTSVLQVEAFIRMRVEFRCRR